MDETIFRNEPGFCRVCGTMLPLLGETGGVSCIRCQASFGAEVFEQPERKYIINFNSYTKPSQKRKKGVNKNTSDNEGPVIERLCPKCGNDKMSYATLQLRSADEGQTVFYTCTKCGYKENENS